jgi:uncharacterized membrane protein YfcA
MYAQLPVTWLVGWLLIFIGVYQLRRPFTPNYITEIIKKKKKKEEEPYAKRNGPVKQDLHVSKTLL